MWLLDRESTVFAIGGQDFLSTQAARASPDPGGQLEDRELPGVAALVEAEMVAATFYGQLFCEDEIDSDFFSVFVLV